MKDSLAYKRSIEQASMTFIEDVGSKIRWNWDEQFHCLLAEFSADHAEHVMLIMKKHFPFEWNKRALKKANPMVKHRAGFFGNLQKQQVLLTKDDNGTNDLMICWWPWGHGATISIRLFQATELPYIEPKGLFGKLKATMFS